jgi:nicotinate-nucleotide adenylyltransferase
MMTHDYEDGISSTLIRERLRNGGSARFLVPEAVATYLEEHRLYRPSA